MLDQKPRPDELKTVEELNLAMFTLVPSRVPITLGELRAPGANLTMLDIAIAASRTKLYDGIARLDVKTELQLRLIDLVQDTVIKMAYDGHGDKHFVGGSAGTKFNGRRENVNLFIQGLIAPLKGRIRSDANGRNQTYYLTAPPNDFTNGNSLVVQLDYVFAPEEKLGYHGYPSEKVQFHRLSRTYQGAPIR